MEIKKKKNRTERRHGEKRSKVTEARRLGKGKKSRFRDGKN